MNNGINFFPSSQAFSQCTLWEELYRCDAEFTAYNNEPYDFEFNNETQTMNESPYDYYWGYVAFDYSQRIYDFEILKTFFSNYHITPMWINCNYTWGVLDKEKGHWTGG